MSALVRRALPLATLLCFGAIACARREGGAARPIPGDATAVPEHFQLSVTRSGGIAGIITTATIDGDARGFTLTSSRSPGDTVTGELSEGIVAEIARLAVDTLPELRADYGTTARSADMYDYVVEATWGSASNGLDSHTIHADEGTAPEGLKQLIARVFGAIDRARGG